MKKLLDRYYLVLMRVPWTESDRAVGFMSMTIMLNVFSLYILFTPCLLVWNVDMKIGFVLLLIFLMLLIFIGARYNKKRREELIEKYKDESRKSRLIAGAWVLAYELFSFAFIFVSGWLASSAVAVYRLGNMPN